MNILAIDTSASLQIITIRKGNTDLNFSWYAGFTHSTTLINRIDEALVKSSLAPEEIDLFGAGIGPGSFTGIRIAATTVRMFAQILEKPVAQTETHRMYAEGSKIQEGSLIVSFDAKKGKVFGAFYSFHGGILKEITAPGDYQLEELVKKHSKNSTLHFIGDGYEKYIGQIGHLIPDHVYLKDYIPDASGINTHIENIFKNNSEQCMDYNMIIPLYRRKSDAEVMMELKTGKNNR